MKRNLRLVTLWTMIVGLLLTQSLVPTETKAQQQSAPTTLDRDEKLWQRALKLQREAIVIDGHNDITSIMVDDDYDIATPSKGKYHTDLDRLREGGMTAEFFSIYVDGKYAKEGGSARRAMDLIDVTYRAAERHPDRIMMASTVADIRRAKKQRKLAALMGIEGGHAIENSLSVLREFYRLGVRYMTLTHNNTNDWADAARGEAKHNGLTDFGKEVVREMNRLGMFIDVSHVSDKTMSDALETSKAPVIASHSSARALCEHPRNINDDLLRRIGQNGGVVMVNFYTSFIDQRSLDAERARERDFKPQVDALKLQFPDDPQKVSAETDKLYATRPLPPTPISVLIDHIDHIAKVAGIDHVGLGSDFDGGVTLPEGITGVQDLPVITYELLRRGYGETDIKKILGVNFLRAFTEVERVARIESRRISGDGSLRRIGK